jgi:FkbM family methyltransferase
MIDCGAYTGDTAEVAADMQKRFGYTIDYIAMLEPDSKNLEILSSNVERLAKNESRAKFFPMPFGVWSESTSLFFSDEGSASSTIVKDADKGTRISVIDIDTVFLHASPNFIKTDVEGAELEALKGAAKTIERHRPVLAVSLYHEPEHLWEIPLMIHEMDVDYDFYIKVHAHMMMETVLYCVPKPYSGKKSK